MTAELVAAYVTKNDSHAAELPGLIAAVHGSLRGLGSIPAPAAEPEKLTPPVSIKKSVTDEYLVSMEDGKHYKSLKRHLATRGLTLTDYRTKWSLGIDPGFDTAGECVSLIGVVEDSR